MARRSGGWPPRLVEDTDAVGSSWRLRAGVASEQHEGRQQGEPAERRGRAGAVVHPDRDSTRGARPGRGAGECPYNGDGMGVFTVDVRVTRPGRRPRWKTFRRVIVDTGAEMTWLPEVDLRSAGVETFKRDQLFVMANGQYVTRHVGMAVIECGEFKTVDEVVFAQPGDLSLLGPRTIEGFNAHVDSRKKRLVAAGPIPVASVRSPRAHRSPAEGRTWGGQVQAAGTRSRGES